MLLGLLLTLFATGFPAVSNTSWMTPSAFHLGVGMKKAKALETLAGGGWTAKPGKAPGQYVVDYADSKSLTLEFANDRLRSIRFELYAFFPEVKQAFREQAERLRRQEGPPRAVKLESVLIYDKKLPNIMVVMSTDRNTEYGRAGVGFLTVRYFEPPPVE